ncbi:MAG: hypothetical protein LN413_04575, partial [Candidatus Thermoplasmatota archaeon]|nr:hypothetical protein [Candidatus Thermoplasmatota archaeon]
MRWPASAAAARLRWEMAFFSARVIWAKVGGSAVRGNDGRPMYALSIMEDIAERMRMESELQTRTQQL